MRCRHCHIALAPLRSLADGEFCCDDHRYLFEQRAAASEATPETTPEPEAIPEPVIPIKLVESRVPAALRMLRLKFKHPSLSIAPANAPPSVEPIAQVEEPAFVAYEAVELAAVEEPALAESVELPVEEFEAASEPVAAEPVTTEHYSDSNEAFAEESKETFEDALQSAEAFQEVEATEDVESFEETSPHAAFEIAASWRWIRTAWQSAPRDLKLVTVLLPILAAVAVTGSFPKVPIKTVAPAHLAEVQKVVNEQWKNFNQTISDRAAIAYADDFRSGLDAWQSRSNLTTSWSYDAAGFVRPGPLAVFKPTLDLADYRFEFLGEIDQKAIGWVFRAEDLNNYYAMKLVVVKPGPLPLVNMVRYAVINGKEGPHVEKPLPLTVRADMLYRLLVDVRGADFTVMAQGQVVDFWTDHRLQHGGVGFFSNRGERSRLRWVEVSHQYDALGRVCAYLAPYGMEGRNGSFN